MPSQAVAAGAVAPRAQPATVRAFFFVTAPADPGLLPRLIEPVAKLGAVPSPRARLPRIGRRQRAQRRSAAHRRRPAHGRAGRVRAARRGRRAPGAGRRRAGSLSTDRPLALASGRGPRRSAYLCAAERAEAGEGHPWQAARTGAGGGRRTSASSRSWPRWPGQRLPPEFRELVRRRRHPRRGLRDRGGAARAEAREPLRPDGPLPRRQPRQEERDGRAARARHGISLPPRRCSTTGPRARRRWAISSPTSWCTRSAIISACPTPTWRTSRTSVRRLRRHTATRWLRASGSARRLQSRGEPAKVTAKSAGTDDEGIPHLRGTQTLAGDRLRLGARVALALAAGAALPCGEPPRPAPRRRSTWPTSAAMPRSCRPAS